MKESKWKTIGFVGVDSGSLIIGDPCYLDHQEDWNPKLYDKWICGALCNSETEAVQINAVCPDQAVAFSSGMGDGLYPVQALYTNIGTVKNPDIRIKEVRILLIQDTKLDKAKLRMITGRKKK
jgi:hypothetical protein